MNFNNGKYDEAEEFKLHQKWMDLRTADINFVLDTILANTKAGRLGRGLSAHRS